MNILHHIIVPESQNPIAMASHVGVALCIARDVQFFAMLAAVQFDRQTPRVTCEVSEVRPDGGLSPKMRAAHRQSAKPQPEFSFGVGRVAAQSPGLWHSLIFATQRTHPLLLPPPLTPPHASRGRGRTGHAFIASYGCRRTAAASWCACRCRTRPRRSSPA